MIFYSPIIEDGNTALSSTWCHSEVCLCLFEVDEEKQTGKAKQGPANEVPRQAG